MFAFKQPVKFGPAHFPIGTLFTVQEEVRHGEEPRVFEVQRVGRNGVDSYVLETTEVNEAVFTSNVLYRTYNIAWVETIVKRGSGPSVVEPGWFGLDNTPKKMKVTFGHLDMMEIRRRLDVEEHLLCPRSGYYTTGSMLSMVAYEVAKQGGFNQSYDFSGMVRTVLQQSWCTTVGTGLFHANSVNKKHLRRWIAQNKNRYLIAYKPWAKAEMEADSKAAEETWDSLRDDLSSTDEALGGEGAFYLDGRLDELVLRTDGGGLDERERASHENSERGD